MEKQKNRKTERDGLRRCERWQQASVPTAGPCPASMECTAGVIISGGVSSSPYYHLTPPLTIHLPSSSHTSSDVNYVSTHICHTNSYCYADMHSRTDTQVAPTSIIIEQLKQDNTWSYQHVTYWFYRHNIQWWEGFQLFNFIELILNKPFDRLKWGFLLKAYFLFILLSKYVLGIR